MQYSGWENYPDYPQELQPRDRTRASSFFRSTRYPRICVLPAYDSGLSSHGAPIIGEDNAVESGNGGPWGSLKPIRTVMRIGIGKYLIEHATEFGIRPEKVESMTAPVRCAAG
ncbi:hypothetical protein [Escherichia coli]|uniref:hypothetical protein n=1 Tax=Escherichia coli TaxID=562 RepID=UPI0015F17798